MALTADDLPPEVKRQLLDRLRAQIGDANYDQLVVTYGEDGVVNLLLRQMGPEQPAPRASAKLPEWMMGCAVLTLLGMAFLFFSLFGQDGVKVGSWSWLLKVVVGSLGTVADLVFLVGLRNDAQKKDSKPFFEFSGCLDAIWTLFCFLMFIGGTILGPVLLVWGLIDLCR
jgi:hypothetical protein